jgi:hypothetical protein
MSGAPAGFAQAVTSAYRRLRRPTNGAVAARGATGRHAHGCRPVLPGGVEG